MPDLRPFRGIRYSSSQDLADKTCPPYDIISEAELERLRAGHPHNAVRLEVAAGDDGRYDEVARTFDEWRAQGVLTQDDQDSFYVYRQDFADHDGRRRSVTGVIGDLRLEPFGAGVLPHEQTMAGPKKDRMELLRACPVNFSPIYAIWHGGGGLTGFYESLSARPPQARFGDASGILHRLWVVTAAAEVDLLRQCVAGTPLVIADGHHRYETALAYRDEQSGPGGHDGIMCFCVDADAEDLVVLAYHRIVKASSTGAVDERLQLLGASRGVAGAPADAPRRFIFVTSGGTWLLDHAEGDRDSASGAPRLDVTILHEEIFPRLFPDGVDEIRFTTDRAEVERLVAEDGYDAGVILQGVDARTVVDVATAGLRMPQKASYFWPKAITGLVFRSLR